VHNLQPQALVHSARALLIHVERLERNELSDEVRADLQITAHHLRSMLPYLEDLRDRTTNHA
jgi:hypothetical protein